jgi:N-methylhydantoinase B
VRNVPVEITEAITPLVVWKKEFRQGSGGPGRQRGGLGQRMEIANRDPAAFGIQARFERGEYPARGRSGGAPGGLGRLSLGSGAALKVKGFQVVPAGDRLIVEMPGGGGYGDPFTRDPEQVARDVRYGLIEAAQAEAEYGVILTATGDADTAATERRRGKAR